MPKADDSVDACVYYIYMVMDSDKYYLLILYYIKCNNIFYKNFLKLLFKLGRTLCPSYLKSINSYLKTHL